MKILESHVGDHGETIRQWQLFLGNQGIALDEFSKAGDGIFGAGTEQGTREYQLRVDLAPTGTVDAKTYAKAVEDDFSESVDA